MNWMICQNQLVSQIKWISTWKLYNTKGVTNSKIWIKETFVNRSLNRKHEENKGVLHVELLALCKWMDVYVHILCMDEWSETIDFSKMNVSLSSVHVCIIHTINRLNQLWSMTTFGSVTSLWATTAIFWNVAIIFRYVI